MQVNESQPKTHSSYNSKLLRALATHQFSAADNQPAEVRPKLFIGSIGAAENEEAQNSLGITHVLSLVSGAMCIRNFSVTDNPSVLRVAKTCSRA
jgi:hypothetical protein